MNWKVDVNIERWLIEVANYVNNFKEVLIHFGVVEVRKLLMVWKMLGSSLPTIMKIYGTSLTSFLQKKKKNRTMLWLRLWSFLHLSHPLICLTRLWFSSSKANTKFLWNFPIPLLLREFALFLELDLIICFHQIFLMFQYSQRVTRLICFAKSPTTRGLHQYFYISLNASVTIFFVSLYSLQVILFKFWIFFLSLPFLLYPVWINIFRDLRVFMISCISLFLILCAFISFLWLLLNYVHLNIAHMQDTFVHFKFRIACACLTFLFQDVFVKS